MCRDEFSDGAGWNAWSIFTGDKEEKQQNGQTRPPLFLSSFVITATNGLSSLCVRSQNKHFPFLRMSDPKKLTLPVHGIVKTGIDQRALTAHVLP
jgi:hypothetical protein